MCLYGHVNKARCCCWSFPCFSSFLSPKRVKKLQMFMKIFLKVDYFIVLIWNIQSPHEDNLLSCEMYKIRSGSRGRVQGVCTPPPRDYLQFSNTTGILPKKITMWFIGVEVEQETSAPLLKKILDPTLKIITWNQKLWAAKSREAALIQPFPQELRISQRRTRNATDRWWTARDHGKGTDAMFTRSCVVSLGTAQFLVFLSLGSTQFVV